jgi:hypothetical protein
MRVTDDRYRAEQSKFQLALRMIRHEARTGTIRYWTGLSDDRIRKLYSSYFKFSDLPVKRRRGKSPMQVSPLIQSPSRALESGMCANLMLANGLFSTAEPPGPRLQQNIDLGHRFCQCYESYRTLVRDPTFSFEWTWNLLISIRRGDELGISRCWDCGTCYVCDLLAIPAGACPACRTFAGEGIRGKLH